MKIDDVVARRTDLSTFLVHLTRETADETARNKLISMLTSGIIQARNPFGPAVDPLKKAKLSTDSQKAVCFTETPLEHVNLLCQDIEHRQCNFEAYGVAITKKQGRKVGVNPIWYLDITKGHTWLMNPINNLIAAEIAAGTFDTSEIAKLTPFMEQMGTGTKASTGEKYQKEFWWEREWRHVGDFRVPAKCIAFCPANQIASLKETMDAIPEEEQNVSVKFIDPRWSMEKIIGRLAGIPLNELGPF